VSNRFFFGKVAWAPLRLTDSLHDTFQSPSGNGSFEVVDAILFINLLPAADSLVLPVALNFRQRFSS